MLCHRTIRPALRMMPVLSNGGGSPAMNDSRDVLAVLCVRPDTGRSMVVEVIPDLATSENLRCHHLRMHMSAPVTQEEGVHAVALPPESRVRNSDG